MKSQQQKQTAKPEPDLYGIAKSNRTSQNHWGKNQFNSSFPASLACYMRDIDQTAIYLQTNDTLEVEAVEKHFDFLFGSEAPNTELSFCFESKFEPYQQYSKTDIKGIDLVLMHGNEYIRALEVKLTVIPDNTTASQPPSDWGTELVIRPATTLYAALGIFQSIEPHKERLKEILDPVCANIQHWDNTTEMLTKKDEVITCLNRIFSEFHNFQKPFLLHPIWKTQGKTPSIDIENAFDIFVWSDFAICRTFIDSATFEKSGGKVSRLYRSSLRLARILYELSHSDSVNIHRIYTEMAFNLQTDKEFALNGQMTRRYMQHERRSKPVMPLESVKQIILNDGHKKLSPERRFDQSLYYTAQELFESKNED
jgi:hypothetical protein